MVVVALVSHWPQMTKAEKERAKKEKWVCLQEGGGCTVLHIMHQPATYDVQLSACMCRGALLCWSCRRTERARR
jgi:hypothetical protein